MPQHTSGHHRCDLQKTSQSCLPTLSPRSGTFAKIIRLISKGRLPTYHHDMTMRYFKSEKSLITERQRLINATPWFVVHPFSIIAIVKDIVITHVFILGIIINNVLTGFQPSPRTATTFYVMRCIEVCLAVIYVIHGFVCPVIGYEIRETMVIELRPKKLLVKYLRTYAIPDILLALPLIKSYYFKYNQLFTLSTIVCAAGIVRTTSFVQSFRLVLGMLYRVPRKYQDMVISALMIPLVLHIFTCFTAALPHLFPEDLATRKNLTSMSRFFSKEQNYDIVELYPIYLHVTLCHFYGAGRGRYGIYTVEESLFFVVVMIASVYFHIHVMITIWALIRSGNRCSTRYEIMLVALNDYAAKKGLTPRLKFRILNYYKQKSRKKTFNEHAFVTHLSEHLRHEINLQTFYHVITTNVLFAGMSKPDLALIMNSLRPLTYISGEVIYKVHDPFVEFFLISRGTVAIYTEHGTEVTHLQDGDLMGLVSFLSGRCTFGAVCVEYTEVFAIPRKAIVTCIERSPNLAKTILGHAAERNKKYSNLENALVKMNIANPIGLCLQPRTLRGQEI